MAPKKRKAVDAVAAEPAPAAEEPLIELPRAPQAAVPTSLKKNYDV